MRNIERTRPVSGLQIGFYRNLNEINIKLDAI